jgi:uncharacterized protein
MCHDVGQKGLLAMRKQSVGSVTASLGGSAVLWLRSAGVLMALAGLLATTGCAWLDAKQRSIIYRPTLGVPADFAGLRDGDTRYFVDVPGTASAEGTAQKIELWWLPHAEPAAPTLLYYHGTFRNLYQNLPKINALREAGFAVLAVEYRGWGQSSPLTPSEQTIVQDALLGFEELRRKEPRPAQRVIYGHSMGSGVAVEVASRLKAPADYGAIILESALTSFPDVAVQASWLGRLISSFNNERFDSISKIAQVQAPLLMLHGNADTTVPVSLGNQLFVAANAPKQWLVIDGGKHSDLHEAGAAAYQAVVRGFKNMHVVR